ncbi:MAG: FkbM family methyltransferase [Pseudomonadota bacterium]
MSGVGATFQRLSRLNLNPASFVNLGAGRGDDSPFYLSHWPDMKILLVDMDTRFVPGYESMQADGANVCFEIAAAGPADGKSNFKKTNDVGGVLDSSATDGDTNVYTVDTLVKMHELAPPYFLKFDTHGVEVDILKGCQETLQNTVLIQMEMYNFDLKFADGKSLRFHNMFAHLEELGFRCVDIVDPLYRPGDEALWQFHGILIRSDHSVFDYSGYSSGKLSLEELERKRTGSS